MADVDNEKTPAWGTSRPPAVRDEMQTPVWGLSRPTPAVGLAVPDLSLDLPPSVIRAQRRIGRMIGGRYQLLRVLGAGSAGAVYAAQDMKRDMLVAVKLLQERLRGSAIEQARFEREVDAATAVHHPNIVRLIERGCEPDGTPFLVLELLDGRGLDGALEEGPMDISAAVDITRQLLAALAAVHMNDYVHRDVKPANVFLTRGPGDVLLVKLLDFGIVRPVQSSSTITGDGVMVGTPTFMSPEQITNDDGVSPATDIWQAGAVFFNMLAGRPPFEDGNLSSLLVKIARNAAPRVMSLRPDCPPQIDAVVAKALENDPANRFENATQMSIALHQAAHSAGF